MFHKDFNFENKVLCLKDLLHFANFYYLSTFYILRVFKVCHIYASLPKISILKDEVFIKRAPDVLLKSQKWLECDIFIFSSPNFDCLFLV